MTGIDADDGFDFLLDLFDSAVGRSILLRIGTTSRPISTAV
jgi:hypothetical protein